LPRDRTGDVSNISGEVVAGEPLVEYAAPVIDTIPAYPYSAEECIALHRARNASRVPPPVRIAPFVRRSLRRFA
jgi:hypothetical protein